MAGCLRHWSAAVLSGLLLMFAVSYSLTAAPALFIEAQLEPANPYIQGQVLYTVRLYHQERYLNGYFVPPEIVDAVTVPLGQSESVEVQRDEGHYWMREQRYLLFPQRSGRLKIPGMVFSGREAYGRGRDLTLLVRPPPATVPAGSWLPAEKVRITEVWPEIGDDLSVGENIERIVTVEAWGITAAQLSFLPTATAAGLKVRRRRVALNDRIEGNAVIGERIEYQTLHFSQAGVLELPPITLDWWDTGSDQPQQVILVGRTVEIRGVDAGVEGAAEGPPEEERDSDVSKGEQPKDGFRTILPDALWFGALMALMGTILLWSFGPRFATVILHRLQCYAAWHQLRRACLHSDAKGAVTALRSWQQLHGNSENTEIGDALGEVETVVYGPHKGSWAGNEFWSRLAPRLHQRSSGSVKSSAGVLPPLRPE
jgi:hypothetical protein